MQDDNTSDTTEESTDNQLDGNEVPVTIADDDGDADDTADAADIEDALDDSDTSAEDIIAELDDELESADLDARDIDTEKAEMYLDLRRNNAKDAAEDADRQNVLMYLGLAATSESFAAAVDVGDHTAIDVGGNIEFAQKAGKAIGSAVMKFAAKK